MDWMELTGLQLQAHLYLSADGRSAYVTSWGEDGETFTRESQSGLLTYGLAKDSNYNLIEAEVQSSR